MSSTWGNSLKISIFGESHGPAIGVTLHGLPAGFKLDMDAIAAHMKRRTPGQDAWSTPRKEEDLPEIISGVYLGQTSGAPLTAIIRNTNTRSGDYTKFATIPRPGHADLTGSLRYHGANDPRGGGHFSGRLTAPLAFAGAIALQMLAARGIHVHAHVYEIAGIRDDEVPLSGEFDVSSKNFPTISDAQGDYMKAAIADAAKLKDSVGGSVETVATGFPPGVGNPMFDRLENRLASLMFGIPAVRGVEFGRGIGVTAVRGSENNDPIRFNDAGEITHTSNHAGGIEGGISNGMPIIMRCAFKPTPSIGATQLSVNLKTHQNDTLEVHGRHDPCIVPRAVPVVESAMALALLDALV